MLPRPLGLVVHPDVAFLCDLHAHLADAEIIGLLGGRWDAATRKMHVQAPFPCRAVARDDDGATDVEMDPASELQVREVIKRHKMDVVGWYHSHPRFVAEPSVTDIENQRSYPGSEKGDFFSPFEARISVSFHSFRLIFGRELISRRVLEEWTLSLTHFIAKLTS